MHQRAVDVHLMPEIQMPCIKDLATHCNDRLNNGEVMTIIMSFISPQRKRRACPARAEITAFAH